MTRLPRNTRVHVDGLADQWPFERIVDEGIILETTSKTRPKYLVQLITHRENLMFLRSELHLRDLTPTA